jgi:hypothetical protein
LAFGAKPLASIFSFPFILGIQYTIHSLPRKYLPPSLCPTRQVMLGRVIHPSTRSTNHSCGRLAHRLDDSTAQCIMHISWQLLSAFSLAACVFKVTRLVPHYISIAASHCISFLRD